MVCHAVSESRRRKGSGRKNGTAILLIGRASIRGILRLGIGARDIRLGVGRNDVPRPLVLDSISGAYVTT